VLTAQRSVGDRDPPYAIGKIALASLAVERDGASSDQAGAEARAEKVVNRFRAGVARCVTYAVSRQIHSVDSTPRCWERAAAGA
jgi:hypothetical protein